ncbi:hypothetical protein [Streptomyces caniscabiei]|nr:hypothetical protein [Streptomyces caniscabiei]
MPGLLLPQPGHRPSYSFTLANAHTTQPYDKGRADIPDRTVADLTCN